MNMKYIIMFYTFLPLISVQSKKPYSTRQQAVWRLECELGVINDLECPVDGGWTPWSPWSPCHGACDDIGHHRRIRQCINPSPSLDGLPCSGSDEQIKRCYLTNCTADDYRKLAERDSARLEALHQLETVPALMERCLQMECPFEAIEAALATDNTWQLNPESLWNALQCVKHNMGCPVVGEWGSWGTWSACDSRCGKGLRWRLRRCDTPPPSAQYLVCTGSPLQVDNCEGDQCAIDGTFHDIAGTWTEWGHWSACSEKCGIGVRRRRRSCNEKYTPRDLETWGTHCQGQHDQLEICKNKHCILDGGWSVWGSWSPCSQSCGAGKRSRIRSCTRPIPANGGTNCVGPRIEVGSCHLAPCEVRSHTVTILNGESFLHYNFENKRSTLFHFYIRFMPLSPHGTLVRRGTIHNPLVRLSLQKWHICLDANGASKSCSLPRICSTAIIEPAVWHTALITVTSEAATLRLDDEPIVIRSTFPCNPELPYDIMNIIVGEKFHGEIQEVILNFIPLKLLIVPGHNVKKSDFNPISTSNIAYEKANAEEAYLILNNDQYVRLPCFLDQTEWHLGLTIKSKRDVGTILFLHDESSNNWLYIILQNNRLKMKLSVGDYQTESGSSAEYPPDQWLDISVSKKRDASTIETVINADERLHVTHINITLHKRRGNRKYFQILFKKENSNKRIDTSDSNEPMSLFICNAEFYVGGVPKEIRKNIPEDFVSYNGVLASLKINCVLQDLHSFSVERYKDEMIQVSSRTASISGSYHETAWSTSNRLNLSCLHTQFASSLHPRPNWLFLDTALHDVLRNNKVRSIDDGRVLRLVASADNDLRGFYTCRAYFNKRTQNIVTYGVLEKIQYKLMGPDTTTIIAFITTLALVIGTLSWLIIEGINDLHNGYGFFRDAHFSPEEEADAVCKYLVDNIDLCSSKSGVKDAKARARRRVQRLASHSSFTAQEPRGLMQIEKNNSKNKVLSTSEPDDLPDLPEVKSVAEPSHEIYRYEPCYISSPRHGSNITSPRTRVTSSSSFDGMTPRLLCSRLLLAKRMYSSKESLHSRNSKRADGGTSAVSRKTRSKLFTIKSSRCMNISPVQKILQKFQELKKDDP
ncbi:uncharacterized protein LOC113516991, partial [Galleria mellonella]|uniref:Uncharacterized protein LOC113516991 n=1 Tax=Galleria mellonella TaxID=7137 RepID=A0A6J1WX52_GALME